MAQGKFSWGLRGFRGAGTGLLLILAFLGAGCQEKQSFVAPPPPKVTVSRPVQQVVTIYHQYTGNTQSFNSVQLCARVEGYLDKVLFKDGEIVKKGQGLFIIQQNTYEAKVQQAEATLLSNKAQLDHAETEYTRYSGLFQQKAASATDVSNWKYQRDAAKAAVLAAQAQLDLARLDLSYTRVTAPFDGRVDRKLKDPGNLVGNGQQTVLAQIDQFDPMYAYFTVNERELVKLIERARAAGTLAQNPSLPVSMGLTNEDGFPHVGVLDYAANTLDTKTGTLLVRGIFKNPLGVILPGMFVRIRVPAIRDDHVMLVPEVAMGADQLGKYVLVVNDKKIVERRGVETGAAVNSMRVIEKGLSGEEWVVVNGIMAAIPGREVNPSQEPLQDAQAAGKESSPAKASP